MSKRSDRRAAEREARKLAFQQLRQQPPSAVQNIAVHAAAASSPAAPLPAVSSPMLSSEEDLLTRAQAFFHQSTAPATQTSEAQTLANQANAKLSCGPVTPEGKAASSQNRRSHGLAGRFCLLPFEKLEDFQNLTTSFYNEHNPETDTEQRLVDAMIQHHWLLQRAVLLQQELMLRAADPLDVDPKRLSLFVRYQTTHERSYYRAVRELQNLRKQKRKEEIGFESQNRRQESHEANVRLAHARACNLEVDSACRQIMEAPIPGNYRISFEELTKACSHAISKVVYQNQLKNKA